MNFYFDNQSLRQALSKRNKPRKKFAKRFVFAAGTLIFGALSFSSCGQSLPAPDRPFGTEYNTIAHEMLDIELVHIEDPQSYERLDQVLKIATHLLEKEPPPKASDSRRDKYKAAVYHLKMIDNILKFYGFKYKKNSLLNTALLTKKIDCDGYSAIYLAVGEVLELPIKMVRAPAHTFVRWHFDEHTYINWETTIGAVKSDSYYIQKHKIPRTALGKSALKSLDIDEDRKEILANTYVNCGVEWLKELSYENALAYFDKAIESDPAYEAPYYNKGLVFFHMGKMDKAAAWCEKAVRLNQNHMKSHAVLGTAYKELNRSKKARLHFRRVRELDPEYYAVKVMEMQLSKIPPLLVPRAM